MTPGYLTLSSCPESCGAMAQTCPLGGWSRLSCCHGCWCRCHCCLSSRCVLGQGQQDPAHCRGSNSSGTGDAGNSRKITDAGKSWGSAQQQRCPEGIRLHLSMKSNALLSQLITRIMQVPRSKLQIGFKINCSQLNILQCWFQMRVFIANGNYFCYNDSKQQASILLCKDGYVSWTVPGLWVTRWHPGAAGVFCI